MNKFSLFSVLLLTTVALVTAERSVSAAVLSQATAVKPAAGDDLPGRIIQSWLANSFSRQEGHHSVPVNIGGIAVTPDGTVFSAGVAEGYGGVASYKDGKFVTKYDYDSGFGSSASAVAVDDSYVYIGTGVGLFRTRLGEESYNRTPITGGKIGGLALREGELYLSDSAAGKIRVLSTSACRRPQGEGGSRLGLRKNLQRTVRHPTESFRLRRSCRCRRILP